MHSGLATLAVNLGPTEVLLIFLVTVPFLILPVVALLWVVFRMGKRQGAAEARREGQRRDGGQGTRAT